MKLTFRCKFLIFLKTNDSDARLSKHIGESYSVLYFGYCRSFYISYYLYKNRKRLSTYLPNDHISPTEKHLWKKYKKTVLKLININAKKYNCMTCIHQHSYKLTGTCNETHNPM